VSGVYLYTNNQCGPKWITFIVNYLNNFVRIKLFDDVIGPYKIKNIITDSKRTMVEKSYIDVLNYLNMPITTKVCFIDNTFYPLMKHENVFYLNPMNYYNPYPICIKTCITELLLHYNYKSIYDNKMMVYKYIIYKYNNKILQTDVKQSCDLEITSKKTQHQNNIRDNIGDVTDIKQSNDEIFMIHKIISKQIFIHLMNFFYP
jgi:hypothetical protein